MFFAIIAIFGWGLWIAPSQGIKIKSSFTRTFWVTLVNAIVALGIILIAQLPIPSGPAFWLPFLGGVMWTISCVFAFLGSDNLGMTKAIGTWAPLNIIFAILWGMILHGELIGQGTNILISALVSVLLMIGGILLIIFSGKAKSDTNTQAKTTLGWIGAITAGVLWGSYFVPISLLSDISALQTAFPMALGMLATSLVLLLINREVPRAENPSSVFRLLLSGILWTLGNYGSLLAIQDLGTGKGFTLTQLNVLVAALVGIIWYKNPHIKSKAGFLTILGVIIAVLAGIFLGTLPK